MRFLQNAWRDWLATGRPTCCRSPGRPGACGRPDNIDGRLGYYSFDAGAPITRRDLAGDHQFGQRRPQRPVRTSPTARARYFQLCRPPGHPPRPTTWAAIASSTMPPSPPRPSSTGAPGGWRSSTSTTTMATAGHLLRPRRCAVHLDPRRSALRIPLFPRLRADESNGVGTGYNFNATHWRPAATGRPGARRCRRRSGESRPMRRTS